MTDTGIFIFGMFVFGVSLAASLVGFIGPVKDESPASVKSKASRSSHSSSAARPIQDSRVELAHRAV